MRILTVFCVLGLMTLCGSYVFAQQPTQSAKKSNLMLASDPKLKTQVMNVMKASESKINRCIDRYLQANDGQSGQIQVAFQITPKGTVQDSKVTSTLKRHAYVHSCLLSVIRAWRFPKHGSNNISMRFSAQVQKGKVFKFSPPKGKNAKNTGASK